MPVKPTYATSLQAYGGIYDATGTQALSSTPAQLATWSAALGPTAYKTTINADFDDITVHETGIYELHFEGNWKTAAAHTVTFSIMDDGTAITGGTIDSMSVTETASAYQHVSTTIVAQVAAGSVLDVFVSCATGTPTLTANQIKFWVRKIAPAN